MTPCPESSKYQPTTDLKELQFSRQKVQRSTLQKSKFHFKEGLEISRPTVPKVDFSSCEQLKFKSPKNVQRKLKSLDTAFPSSNPPDVVLLKFSVPNTEPPKLQSRELAASQTELTKHMSREREEALPKTQAPQLKYQKLTASKVGFSKPESPKPAGLKTELLNHKSKEIAVPVSKSSSLDSQKPIVSKVKPTEAASSGRELQDGEFDRSHSQFKLSNLKDTRIQHKKELESRTPVNSKLKLPVFQPQNSKLAACELLETVSPNPELLNFGFSLHQERESTDSVNYDSRSSEIASKHGQKRKLTEEVNMERIQDQSDNILGILNSFEEVSHFVQLQHKENSLDRDTIEASLSMMNDFAKTLAEFAK